MAPGMVSTRRVGGVAGLEEAAEESVLLRLEAAPPPPPPPRDA